MKKNINKLKILITSISLAILTLIVVIFVACNDNNETHTQEERIYKSISTYPDNKDNPYDYIGKQHNILLNQLLISIFDYETKTGDTFKGNFDKVVSFGSKYINDNGFDTNGNYNMLKALYKNDCNFFFDLIDNQPIDISSKECIKNICRATVSMYIKNPKTSYNEYYDYIISVEKNILNGKISISPKYIENIFSFTATFRYSLYFWMNDNYFHNTQKSLWRVVGWDAVGALVGSLVGHAIDCGTIASLYAAMTDKDATVTVNAEDSTIHINY